MEQFLNLVYSVLSSIIKAMRDFKIIGNVSLLNFFIVLILMGIVIKFLVPTATSPDIQSKDFSKNNKK